MNSLVAFLLFSLTLGLQIAKAMQSNTNFRWERI